MDEFKKVPKLLEEDDMVDDDDEKEGELPKMSKRKLKKLNRLSVAELKQLVSRPDVVEMHDVTARDPRLLVHLKSTRNTVPVPRHWCFKRKVKSFHILLHIMLVLIFVFLFSIYKEKEVLRSLRSIFPTSSRRPVSWR